ncbi:hypothetical protein O6H91_18G009200 [Diphasiastrum complanatum]|uniref:Uncharacterized protein n=4 Tax=Diphasiastrum complanatum TaxID=34168 RepID=A0ACC2AXZ1_DIPCM|nr:hypothetical protein O6H91_18G009200 [Diphasiastrum complanatum]KAJ7522399.1 hypothetical protein O6H91_18G009200 [Diphasiastrum complanatum]KAJ7522400.1 hypothetical protein O6H91_18G009200 [Diphasiastrum complanatum]KAJ7522404.1 hypothetical protein O6H91_18G009200 [Diphasiastrum complanatum]
MVPVCRLNLALVESDFWKCFCMPLRPCSAPTTQRLLFTLKPTSATIALRHFSGRKLQFVGTVTPALVDNVAARSKKTNNIRHLSGQLAGNILFKQDTKLNFSKLKTRASRITRNPSLKSIEEAARKKWLLSLSSPSEGDDLPVSTSNDLEVQDEDEDYDLEMMSLEGVISSSNNVPDASSSELVIGVDPDVSGAMAVLKVVDSVVIAQVLDVPTVKVMIGKRMRRRHDTRSIVNIVNDLRAPQGSIAYVEQSLPFPKDGKQAWWSTGFGYGVWIGALVASGFSVVPIRPQAWKSAMGLLGSEYSKDDSRLQAATLFPNLSSQLQRKKDHGRAEALLIAAFGKGIGAVCA